MKFLCIYTIVVIVSEFAVEPGLPGGDIRRKNVKKAKLNIDLRNPYYQARFEVCKKTRIFNPVELVRAQAYAAETFRRCGPKIVVRLASKYSFPAYGIIPASRIACFFFNAIWAFFADDGGLIIPESIASMKLFEMASYYFPAIEKSGHIILFKNGNSSYTVSRELIAEIVSETLICVFYKERIHPVDGDYLKHGINHLNFMLL